MPEEQRSAGFSAYLRRFLQLGLMPRDPIQCFVEWHRAGDAEALNMITPELRQKRVFANCLNAFGQCLNFQPFGHRENRANELLLVGILVGFHYKRAVDLDP